MQDLIDASTSAVPALDCIHSPAFPSIHITLNFILHLIFLHVLITQIKIW